MITYNLWNYQYQSHGLFLCETIHWYRHLLGRVLFVSGVKHASFDFTKASLFFWMYSTAWRYENKCMYAMHWDKDICIETRLYTHVYVRCVFLKISIYQLYPASTFAMASFPNNLCKVHINHYYYSIYAHPALCVRQTTWNKVACQAKSTRFSDDFASFFGTVTWDVWFDPLSLKLWWRWRLKHMKADPPLGGVDMRKVPCVLVYCSFF